MLSINAINKSGQYILEIGDIVEQCRFILRNNAGVSVIFARKRANRLAHALAGLPCTFNNFVEVSTPPLCMLKSILLDV